MSFNDRYAAPTHHLETALKKNRVKIRRLKRIPGLVRGRKGTHTKTKVGCPYCPGGHIAIPRVSQPGLLVMFCVKALSFAYISIKGKVSCSTERRALSWQ